MATPFWPPENYYRVSIKALIFDEHARLLVFQDKQGEWEIPGGGLDHAEDYETCIRRELAEEVGAQVENIGPLAFFYRCQARDGQPKISLAFTVRLHPNTTLQSQEDDLVSWRYVSKEEFVSLPFQKGEAPVVDHAAHIWQQVENNS